MIAADLADLAARALHVIAEQLREGRPVEWSDWNRVSQTILEAQTAVQRGEKPETD